MDDNDNGLLLQHIAAPMVNQSDLPFRQLVLSHGATVAFTQMLLPQRLLNDREYLEYWLRDLTSGGEESMSKTVVQLCGNDTEELVQAGRKVAGYCSGIGMPICERCRCSLSHPPKI